MWKGFNKCYDTQIDYNCYVLPPYYTWYEISDRNIQHLALWTLSDYRIYLSCPQRQGSYEYIPHHSYHKKLLNDFRIAVLFWGCCTNKDKWSSSTYIRPTKTVFIHRQDPQQVHRSPSALPWCCWAARGILAGLDIRRWGTNSEDWDQRNSKLHH